MRSKLRMTLKEQMKELIQIKDSIDTLRDTFKQHTSDDGVHFSGVLNKFDAIITRMDSIESQLRAGVEDLQIKINKKLDKAVFTMFITIALPVFGGIVWYMVAVNQKFAETLDNYGAIQNLNALKIEKTNTDVTWIREKLSNYEVRSE